MNDAASVMEMYLAVFPNYEDVTEFEDSLHEVAKYMIEKGTGVRDRMKQVGFLVSILEAPVLTEFPIDQECLRSAFRQGYTATDAMVTWKPGATSEVAIASHALAGESQDAFFECKSLPSTKPSGFKHDRYSFPVNGEICKWRRWDGLPPDGKDKWHWQQYIKDICDKKEIEIEIQCPKDYELEGLEIDRATFDCKSKINVQGNFMHMHPQYTVIYIDWTCYTKAGQRYGLDKMETCHMMTDAMKKTFRPLDKKVNPFDPSQSTLLSHDKALGPLASFFEKVSGRTRTVRMTGQTCNKLQKGAHGLRVGPNFLQVGHFRFRADAAHIWVDSPRKVSQIYRRDQRMFRGGRASRWRQIPHGSILKSLDMKIPENWGVHFGDRFIQLGNWRLADIDGTHFSISYKKGGEAAKVVQVLRSDGTSHPMRGGSRWQAWNRKVGAPQNIFMGHYFIQIGEWRLAALSWRWMVITHIKTGKTASMFDGHHGRAAHGGGRSHPEVLARPICPPSAPEV